MTKEFLHVLYSAFIFIVVNSLVPAQAQTKVPSKETAPSKPDAPQHDPPITRPMNIAIGEAGNNTGFDMAPEQHLK